VSFRRLGGRTAEELTMNPRLVEPGFVVVCAYTRTSPLVPGRRTTTATTTGRLSGDMREVDDIRGRRH